MSAAIRQPTESRQAEIIATVLALAAQGNPADITTTDIARAMNVTQGALFRHFPTKEAMRLAVVEWIEATLLAELQAARQAAPGTVQSLAAMFLAHVAFARRYPGVPRLIFSELQQPDESPVRFRVQAIMHRYRAMLAEIIAQAKSANEIHAETDGEAAAAMFLGAIQGLVIQSLLGNRPNDALVQGVLSLYLASLGAKP